MRWFTAGEVDGLDPAFVARHDEARTRAGVPFRITSGYRPGDDKAHGLRVAVDIAAEDSRTRFHVVRGLLEMGFERIGVYDRHVHVDEGDRVVPAQFPQMVMWWGTSKSSLKKEAPAPQPAPMPKVVRAPKVRKA